MAYRGKTIICILLSITFFSFVDANETDEKKHMMSELETIKNIFDFQYAPKAWKKEYFGWDLENEIEKSKQCVLATNDITAKDFQIIVRNFFRSTRDYHVKVLFFSTETAFLPLEVKGANGRYFITHVNKSLLSTSQYPIQAGDEVLLFHERPINDVISELQMEEFGTSGTGTDRSLTEHMLTNRLGVTGQEVPRGPVSIQVRHRANASINTYQLIWSYTPEKMSNNLGVLTPFFDSREHKATALKHFNKPWLTPYGWDDNFQYDSDNEDEFEDDEIKSPFALGAKKTFMPTLGRIWWSNDKKYWNACIFETPGHQLVGYLRIPHYKDILGTSMDELKKIIQLFEERTDALVIDQVNNPGGMVFYMYAIASLLTDQALHTPKHRMAIVHEDVYNAVESIPLLEFVDSDRTAVKAFGKDISGYPISYQFAQHWLEFCRFISDQWKMGKKLTDPYHLYGVDHINPNVYVRYTKPLLILINEMDFSCADFLPAIMQDNKRATIMGTQTAGAGGYVMTNMLNSRFGIAGFKITGSIANRPDNQPIENLGVTPDILYELTEEDYQHGFKNYKNAVLDTLNNMLK